MSGMESVVCERRGDFRTHGFASSSVAKFSDQHTEEVELMRRGTRTAEKNPIDKHTFASYAVAPVRQDDTLVTIALRYGCKVAHLKQLNHMIVDQDVFGVRTIRVPVKHHGIVEENIKADTEANASFFSDESKSSTNLTNYGAESDNDSVVEADDDQRHPLLRRASVEELLSSQGKQAVEYLHGVDRDVKGVVSAVAALRASSDTIDASVSCRRQHRDSLTMWDFDCGIRWSTAIVIMVVVVVAVPVLIFVSFWYKSNSSS